jgi:L-seryl-tRNA(Ser) seleniumtransferase
MESGATKLRALPSLDRLLSEAPADILVERFGRQLTLAALRRALVDLRVRLLANGLPHSPSNTLPLGTSPAGGSPDDDSTSNISTLIATAAAALEQQTQAHLCAVFNMTGTVLHTNLGRALLPPEALEAMRIAASEPVNLEYSLQDGKRGDRDDLIESLLIDLTGAPAATVVNNNAAAVFLSLHALASGRQAILSRGELVEIGGAFRIPDIMRRAQVKLVEVGTTNRTRLSDYEEAITARTALLMRVHTSNYVVSGFTESTPLSALAVLAQKHQIALMEDLGSGALLDLARFGLPSEPVVGDSIRQGADLVTFSGDKLLGGPQAGIIVGRKDLIQTIKRNPLKRALRVDKVTLAALEAVLRLYQDPDRLAQRLPTLRLLTRNAAAIEPVARSVARCLAEQLPGSEWIISVEACASMIGSGSQPVERLPSMAVVVRSVGKVSGRKLSALETRLRRLPRPVIGRIHADALWLDCRMIEHEAPLINTLAQLDSQSPPDPQSPLP